jgi:hypothetical protein
MELDSGSRNAMEMGPAQAEWLRRNAQELNGESTRPDFLRNYRLCPDVERRKKTQQRSIVLYLARKGLSPLAVHDNLVTTLGADANALSYSSVTRYLRDAVFTSSNPPTPLPEPEAQFDNYDHAIMLSSWL